VGLATAALVLLPALVAFTVPEAPPTPSRWFRGRFTEIRREALAVLRSPKRRWGVELLVYVGGFEDNAFTRRANHNRNSDLISSDTREILMAHEFTHAIQIGMGSFSGSFQRTVGTIVVAEGLASRVTEKLFPNRPETDNIEFTNGWLKEAEQRKAEILQDIRPFLTSDKPDDIERFTIGPGPAGLEREAYFAGWLVVGDWLAHGMSFSEIARIPAKEMPQRAAAEIAAILAASKR
jgi:hypothetical protein